MANASNQELLINFGNHVRKFRLERGWSQAELDAESGVDRVQIERIENAKINTSISVAHKLAQAFQITLAELFEF